MPQPQNRQYKNRFYEIFTKKTVPDVAVRGSFGDIPYLLIKEPLLQGSQLNLINLEGNV